MKGSWIALWVVFWGTSFGTFCASAQDDVLTIDERISAHLDCAQTCRAKQADDKPCSCVVLSSVAQRRLRELERGGAVAVNCLKARNLEAAHQATQKVALLRLDSEWTRAVSLRASASAWEGMPHGNIEKFRREADSIAVRFPLKGDLQQIRRHLLGRDRELRHASKQYKVYATQPVYAHLLRALAETRSENFWLLELGVACRKLPLTAIIPTGAAGRVPASVPPDEDEVEEPAGEHSSSHLDEYGSDH
mgnify:CR=1 FL=1